MKIARPKINDNRFNRLIWLKNLKKPFVSLLLALLTIILFLSNTAFIANQIMSEEIVSDFSMSIDINEYAVDTLDSNYYAWRGNVLLSGSILSDEITEDTVNAYLDNEITPVFTIKTSEMTLSAEKYIFQKEINTLNYERGYHTLRLYDGTITGFSEKTPLYNFPIYIDYAVLAEIYNVASFCNMRSEPTREATLLASPDLGETVDLLGTESGQQVSGTGPISSYNTNIWYKVNYVKDKTLSTGYILSAFVKKIETGISKMKITAQDAVIPEFLSSQLNYELNLPYSSFDLKISDLVLYNKEDTLRVYINGVESQMPFNSLPLKTGDNVVEFKCQSKVDASVKTYKYSIWRIAQSTEAEFNAQLAKFPESYKAKLKLLHSKYPKWVFTAFNTNLSWDTVIDNEDSGSTSLIEKSTATEYKYNDTIVDGDSFVRASTAAVEYYMDPRNFFDEQSIFEFEQLSYQPNIHTIAGVQKLTDGSGLAGRQQLFINAAIASGVSPYHLAARSKQEVTVWSPSIGLSTLATGKYTGANNIYYGLYNFYNIGTGSSSDFSVLIQRGLNFAKGNKVGGTAATFYLGVPKTDIEKAKYNLPWDSEADAITGGAKYIGATYINQGQDTLYLQKFDVDPINGLYSHQYMQNIQAPYYEAKNAYKAYSQTGGLTNSFVFRIPVYLNMPQLCSPKPEDTNKLSTLTVTDSVTKTQYSLTPSFDPSKDTIYQATVLSETSSITLSATSLNSKAVITGTGNKSLEFGSNNHFVVSCTPSSGVKRDYTIKITRNMPESSSNNYLSSISVTNGNAITSMLPVFNPDTLGPYSIEVPQECEEVTLAAITSDQTAIISGVGPKSIVFGLNNFDLTVVAQNGSKRVYAIKINRPIPKLSSKTLVMSGLYIKGISEQSTANTLIQSFVTSVATTKVFALNGKECTGSESIGTGMIVRSSYQDKVLEEYTVILYGDVNGDGKINSTDITIFKRHILRLSTLKGPALLASDVNRDGKYNSTDYTIIKRKILRLQTISQK